MRLSQNRFRELLLLTGLCGFFFFFRLSGFGLLGPDEPRYAQVAREMLTRHDWITPVLYGHNWLEKPILLYWGEMLSYRIFGVSDWAARVPSALAATLLVFGTFLTVRRIRHEARLDAALMIASAVLILGFARGAATDMLLAAPWSLSLLAWFCWYQSRFELSSIESSAEDGSTARFWLILFYALNALAMLAKGPVAPVLAAFVLITFCITQRNLRALRLTLDPMGLAFFFAVAAPWYVLIQLRTPEFFRVFFLQHNLARFGSNLYRHKQPFWYYVPVALVATLPWTVWLIHGLSDAFGALRAQLGSASANRLDSRPVTPADEAEDVLGAANSAPAPPAFTFEIFLLIWALIPIAFFSLSHSKLPGYILPSIPALLILSAVAVHRRAARDERPLKISIIIHAVLMAAIAAALCVAPRLAFKLSPSSTSIRIAAVAAVAIFVLVILPLFIEGWRMLRFVTLVPIILAVGFLLRGLSPAVDATQSSRPVAELLQQLDQPGNLPVTTFSLSRNIAFGLAFYLDRRVAPYEGLEISPAVYELPAAIPSSAHILVTRAGALPALRLLLPGRSARFLGSYRPQNLDIYEISPVP